ncbi:MAG: YgaP family membrane protein [Pseudobdellovibrionaceae bacterium]
MKTNIHPIERYLRVAVGLFLMSLAFWGPSSLWFLLGIIPVATGLSGWCPLYKVLGMSTCKIDTSSNLHPKY